MRKLFQTAWPYVWRHRRGFLLGIGSLVVKDVLGAALPLVIRGGIDSLTAGFRIGKVFQFAGALIALSVLKGIFQYWMRVILIGISRDMEYDLRNDLFAHLITLSSNFFSKLPHRRHHGAVHQRSERGAHDARPGHHVLDRDHPDGHTDHRSDADAWTGNWRCWRCFRPRW